MYAPARRSDQVHDRMSPAYPIIGLPAASPRRAKNQKQHPSGWDIHASLRTPSKTSSMESLPTCTSVAPIVVGAPERRMSLGKPRCRVRSFGMCGIENSVGCPKNDVYFKRTVPQSSDSSGRILVRHRMGGTLTTRLDRRNYFSLSNVYGVRDKIKYLRHIDGNGEVAVRGRAGREVPRCRYNTTPSLTLLHLQKPMEHRGGYGVGESISWGVKNEG
ncbi:hypothetical protein C8F04DRAFT_1190024 [Mycena alexandri]|uniref:Uncharacterized protein n=1 Tax=Mycena alexandri TaxID=1745969 RepID=A0AAD6SJZ0_9AGAR|nr:hypothetical protein C8F04DRAFT_1190024 [Mycena alexandri]